MRVEATTAEWLYIGLFIISNVFFKWEIFSVEENPFGIHCIIVSLIPFYIVENTDSEQHAPKNKNKRQSALSSEKYGFCDLSGKQARAAEWTLARIRENVYRIII